MKRRSQGAVYILCLSDRLADRERMAGEGGIQKDEDEEVDEDKEEDHL